MMLGASNSQTFVRLKTNERVKERRDAPFKALSRLTYLSSGPIVVMILEGENSVLNNRKLMGATNPKDAEENTIRKLYGISIDKNSVHGSDSIENAKKEIDFFFKS